MRKAFVLVAAAAALLVAAGGVINGAGGRGPRLAAFSHQPTRTAPPRPG